MLAQAALVNEKQAASIISNTPVDKGQRLKLQVTPQSEAGYSLNQFGVWARLEDEDEKMIALFQTDTDIGVEIPSKGGHAGLCVHVLRAAGLLQPGYAAYHG